MKNLIYNFLFVAAMFAANTSVSAQTLMRVHLNDGSIISALVINIDSVTWATTDIGQNVEGETSVTGLATNITKNSATITSYANGILNNLATDIRVGIIYTSNGTPTRSNGTITDIKNNAIASDGSYSITLTGLNPETTYSYRSFVFQSGIWFYGNIRTFTTTGSGELFTTGAVSDVTCFSASVTASVNVDASVPYNTLSYGICYGTTINPTTDGLHTEAKNRNKSTGEFTAILRGLYGGTTYYYRPYAVIDGVTKYGQNSQFQTLEDNVVETVSIDVDTRTAIAHLKLGGGSYSTIKLGFCYGHGSLPTIKYSTITTNEVDDERNFTVILPSKYPNGLCYFRPYVLIDGTPHYGEVANATFPLISVGEAIDLGLSVKWASMNIGASKPEDTGDFFAWGETEPKQIYDWSTYHFFDETTEKINKYCCFTINGIVDNKTILEDIDDAASTNCGDSWRIPTYEEIQELGTQCTWIWGENGYTVIGKNGNKIFLPAAGCTYGNNYNFDIRVNGLYWSTSLNNNDSENAKILLFRKGDRNTYNSSNTRYFGLSIRPVTDY